MHYKKIIHLRVAAGPRDMSDIFADQPALSPVVGRGVVSPSAAAPPHHDEDVQQHTAMEEDLQGRL